MRSSSVIKATFFLLFVGFVAAYAQGWSVYATRNSGKVYVQKVGGNPQEVYNASRGKAVHARWSQDGTTIFFNIGTNIWAMDNDGKNQRKIGSGTTGSGSTMSAYLPEPKSVLVVDGRSLHKINAVTEKKELVANFTNNPAAFYGEIDISADGTRVAARLGNNLYKATIRNKSGTWQRYAGYCSASLSPNGQWLIENQRGHKTMDLIPFGSGSKKTMRISLSTTFDNQSFAPNSNDWISVLFDNGPTNYGDRVGAHQVSTNKTVMVGKLPGSELTMYPDFYVTAGNLPNPGGSVTPPNYSLSTNTIGQGAVSRAPDATNYASGTEVTLTANAASGWTFSGWSGDLSGATNPAKVTMSANRTVTATFTQVTPSNYTFTTNISGEGTVTRSPDATSYASGTEVILTASAASGWTFSGWSGDLSGAANPAKVTMSANRTVTATFISESAVVSIPGTIQAQDYDAGSTTLGTNTSASEGGDTYVGAINTGSWMEYNVSVEQTGRYVVQFRVATPNDDAVMVMKNQGGDVLCQFSIPVTGEWQIFTTVYDTVDLVQGNQTLRLESVEGRWNINWFSFELVSETSVKRKSSGISPNSLSVHSGSVHYTLSQSSDVFLGVYDIRGRLFHTSNVVNAQTGTHQITLPLQKLSNGKYILEFRTNTSHERKVFTVH